MSATLNSSSVWQSSAFNMIFEKRVVYGLVGGANEAALDAPAAFFGERGGEFFE